MKSCHNVTCEHFNENKIRNCGINLPIRTCVNAILHNDAIVTPVTKLFTGKIKSVCYKCRTFNPAATGRYKCAIPGKCPGISLSTEKIRMKLLNHFTKEKI